MKPLVLLVDSQVTTAHPRWKWTFAAVPCEVIEAAALSDIGADFAHPRLVLLGFCGSHQALKRAAEVHRIDPSIPVILVVAESSEELAVSAFRAGVTDYFHAFRDEAGLLETVRRWSATPTAKCAPVDPPDPKEKSFFFIGSTDTMLALKTQIARIAASSSTVLITGETGTGKELVASAIHEVSQRSHSPFVSVNCAAIPDALAESEFFGYERGAFTGAYLRNQGWLEAAHRGTMFLDEVGDMSSVMQAKLLRVIENKEFRRLGGKAEIRVDVRFIAATNRNLETKVSEGLFREDLYYRLNIARVHLPPLRDRCEDIPILIRHYLREFSEKGRRKLPEITDHAWRCLLQYDWPGNVRELKNVLEAALVNSVGGIISIDDFPYEFRKRCSQPPSPPPNERQALISALLETKWNKSRAAEQLCWSRMTLYRKMRKYRISSCSDNRFIQ